jgi:hypothetical protein
MDQRDRNINTRRDYLRRDDGSLSILPIALALAFVFVLGYFLLNRTTSPTTTHPVTGQNEPATRVAPPVTTPAPAPTPAPKTP